MAASPSNTHERARGITSTSHRARRPISERRTNGRADGGQFLGTAGARAAVRVRDVTGRPAEGLLQGSQSVAERRRRHERNRDHHRRLFGDAREIRHGELGVRRGARTADRHVVVARQPQDCVLPLRRETGPRLLRHARADAPAGHDRCRGVSEGRPAESDRRSVRVRRLDPAVDQDRRPRREAVRRRRRRALCLSRHVVARRPGAALLPHEPVSERDGGHGGESAHRRLPRDSPRGMADRLGQRPAAAGVPARRQAVHLGVAAERLGQFLPLRSHRQAGDAPHDEHHLRSRDVDQGRRYRRRRLLHRARRRQLPEVPAPSGRPRRQGRSPPDRSGVSPQRRELPHRRRSADRPGRVPGAMRHLAGQQVLHRRLPDARYAAGHAHCRRRARDGPGGPRAERHGEVRRARPEEGRDVFVHRRRRQNPAARADSISVDVRSGPEVSGARQRVRRARIRRQHGARNVRDAERHRRSTASSC